MNLVKTYLKDPDGVDLIPSRTRLLFRAYLGHGPGHSEQLCMFIGPTRCGRFDALWLSTDWSNSKKQAVAWLPRREMTGADLWQTLLEAYWRAEKEENEADQANYDEIIPDAKAMAAPSDVKALGAIIWPDRQDD